MLSAPDDYLSRFRELNPAAEEFDGDDLIAHAHELHKRDPSHSEPVGDVKKGWSEFHVTENGRHGY
jgi:hypothetical protein